MEQQQRRGKKEKRGKKVRKDLVIKVKREKIILLKDRKEKQKKVKKEKVGIKVRKEK